MSAQSYRRTGRGWVLVPLMLLVAGAPALPATTAAAAPPPGTPVLHQSAELVSHPLGTYRRQFGLSCPSPAFTSCLARTPYALFVPQSDANNHGA